MDEEPAKKRSHDPTIIDPVPESESEFDQEFMRALKIVLAVFGLLSLSALVMRASGQNMEALMVLAFGGLLLLIACFFCFLFSLLDRRNSRARGSLAGALLGTIVSFALCANL